jgi:hypothetical protein
VTKSFPMIIYIHVTDQRLSFGSAARCRQRWSTIGFQAVFSSPPQTLVRSLDDGLQAQ